MKWVKISEKLPKDSKQVTGRDAGGDVFRTYQNCGTWYNCQEGKGILELVEWLDESEEEIINNTLLQQEIKNTNQKLFNVIEKLYNKEQIQLNKITDTERLNWLENAVINDNDISFRIGSKYGYLVSESNTLREFIDKQIK